MYVPEIFQILIAFFLEFFFFAQNTLAHKTQVQAIFSCMDSNEIWYTFSAIFNLSVHQILNNFEWTWGSYCKWNYGNYGWQSIKILNNFQSCPAEKLFGLLLRNFFQLFIHHWKVDRFELLMNQSNIACFMINKRTRCIIYTTINGMCKGPCEFRHWSRSILNGIWNITSTILVINSELWLLLFI